MRRPPTCQGGGLLKIVAPVASQSVVMSRPAKSDPTKVMPWYMKAAQKSRYPRKIHRL
jgi:hypothetical protein